MTSAAPGATPATARETAVAAAVTVIAVGLFLVLSDPVLLGRPYWYDELCCTMFAVQDASSPLDLFRYVRRQDVAPPLLHTMVWLVTRAVGSVDPYVVRSFALACTIAALVVVYHTLRRNFDRSSAAAGALAVASSSVVLQHATEARFYAPWLLFATLFIAMLSLDAGRPSRRRDVAIAIVSTLLCTIHWFGVISLGLMAAGAVVAHGRRWREGVRLVAPGAAGVIAFAALTPMMLDQLRAGGEAIRWVPPLKRDQLVAMAHVFVLRGPLVFSVLIILVARLLGVDVLARVRELLRDPSIAAALATLTMPLALIAITVTIDSVMVPRYAMPAALAAAPVAALTVSGTRRWTRVAALAFYAIALLLLADRQAQFVEHGTAVANAYRAQYRMLQQSNPNVPLVFQSGMRLYDVTGPLRKRGTARVLLLPDSVAAGLYPGDALEELRWQTLRESKGIRNHYRVFGFPEAITLAELDTTTAFILFTTDQDLPPLWQSVKRYGDRLFPNHHARRLSGIVTVYERVKPAASQ